jgi:multidrug resistance efflux pump
MTMRIDSPPPVEVDGSSTFDPAAAPPTIEHVDAAPESVAATRRRPNPRRVLLVVLPIVLAVAAIVGYSMYRDSILYVSTENAQVAGQPVQVGPLSAGRVETLNVRVGSAVRRNDVLASVALPSQTGTTQNGQPRLGFLGAADVHLDVVAPRDGVVIAVPAAVGASVAAGQPIVTIVDPTELWVNANIEESSVGRLRVGQPVQVHIDGFNEDVVGRVEAITPATASTFSLVPTNNSSGNFTRVTQLVPVRIAINLSGRPTMLGSSAEVKIRVAD